MNKKLETHEKPLRAFTTNTRFLEISFRDLCNAWFTPRSPSHPQWIALQLSAAAKGATGDSLGQADSG
jgi:superfamily I DNA and RNA helicase